VVEFVALYILWPSLVAVYSAFGSLASLQLKWLVLLASLEVASFACLWVLTGIALRSTRWRLIAAAEVVGNAVGQVIPGGNVTGAATEIYLLTGGGVDGARASTGVVAAGLVNLATLFALPILIVPALVSGVQVSPVLLRTAWIAVGVCVLLTAGLLVLLIDERPARAIGRFAERLRNSFPRSQPLTGVPERLAEQRLEVLSAFRVRWGQAIASSTFNWLFDYLALVTALIAVGARLNPAVVLLVYTATIWVASLPVTPGGLGLVEAGMLGLLVLAGVPAPQAALATLAYRLVSYVAPVIVGFPTYWWYRRRLAVACAQAAETA
jgi:uncharacterized protein (TIRG00374 family)